jgi:Leucine-rich repeat (LRR) protein
VPFVFQVLDLSCNTALFSLGSGFSSLSSLTELNLAGPNCLFKDPVHQHSTPASHSAAGGNVVSFAAVAGLGQGPPAGDAADASAPQLSHEQQLQLLPQLAQLTRLRKLSLAHNRDMLVLPASVCSLTQLEVLDVRSCSLRYLNEELWDCGGLRELLLGDNVLDELPDDIGRLQQLEVRVRAL